MDEHEDMIFEMIYGDEPKNPIELENYHLEREQVLGKGLWSGNRENQNGIWRRNRKQGEQSTGEQRAEELMRVRSIGTWNHLKEG